MKIGINIDGVLINKTEFQYKNGLKYFGKNLRYANECAYSFRSMFNCSNEEEKDFWNKNRFNYYCNTKPEIISSECLKQLHEKGCEIYLITNRIFLNEKRIKGSYYRYLLKLWLKKNEIQYDGIIYCDKQLTLEEKTNVCIENQFDFMIEDSISNSIILSKICNVLLYNRPYNIGFSYVKRVNNFEEISKEIIGKEKVKK